MGCDEVRARCKCGAPLAPGFDECREHEVEFALTHPEDFDENFDLGCYDTAEGREIARLVFDERLRRFAAGERVYAPVAEYLRAKGRAKEVA
jgi:hypothetical protein